MLRDFRHGYVMFFIFLISIICGAFYCVFLSGTDFESIGEYFSGYFSNAINSDAVFKKALLNNVILGIILFGGGFAKAGIIFIAAAVFKEGFVTGFCCACLSRAMGFNGALAGAVSELHMLIFLPLMVISSDKSIKMGKNFRENSKNLKIFFIFFQIFVITIFCGCAFMEGYVNTIFMEFLKGKFIK